MSLHSSMSREDDKNSGKVKGCRVELYQKLLGFRSRSRILGYAEQHGLWKPIAQYSCIGEASSFVSVKIEMMKEGGNLIVLTNQPPCMIIA